MTNPGTSSASTRRRFLGTAAGATGMAIAASVMQGTPALGAESSDVTSRATSAGGTRAYTAGRVGLELGGVSQGYLKGVDGGDAFCDVVVIPATDVSPARKHLGALKYDDFFAEFGFGNGIEFDGWVVGAVDGSHPQQDGAVVTTDLSSHITSVRAFQRAIITAVGIPALDAASKDPGVLSVTFAPESVADAARTGTFSASTAVTSAWLSKNFKIEIDGLDCSKVNKIDAITIKQLRDGVHQLPTEMEYPNLGITFTATSLPTWKAWFDDFVVAGNDRVSNEKNGRITLLSSTGVELAVLQLHGIGIFALDPDPELATGETIARSHAELYVQTMNFTKLGAWILT